MSEQETGKQNMSVQEAIEKKLRQAFEITELLVENESHMHSVPVNSETHFKVVLVSEQFTGQRQVQRHQSMYRLLASELSGPVHALALHTYSPAEWQERNEASGEVGLAAAPSSPSCMGGGQ